MHDIIQFQGIIGNKKKKKKNVLIRIMVTKLFGHLLSQFNSLKTQLRKIKKTCRPVFSENVHVINFLGWWRS